MYPCEIVVFEENEVFLEDAIPYRYIIVVSIRMKNDYFVVEYVMKINAIKMVILSVFQMKSLIVYL